MFYDVTLANTEDNNGNGYLEWWDFRIDVDAFYGDITDNVTINIWDDEGHEWGPFGPYNFSGQNSNDIVTITDFSSQMYQFEYPQTVSFFFEAVSPFGSDLFSKTVEIDLLYDSPEVFEIYTVNGSDLDNDTYFDIWDFELDIDAENNSIAQNVFVEITDNKGNNFGTFGPYSFEGQTSNDNLLITDFSYNTYNLTAETNVLFTFQVYNTYGDDVFQKTVKVDTWRESPTFYEITKVNTLDLDNDGKLEKWDFELDIDALFNGLAEDVSVTITDNLNHNYGTFGVYDFEGETGNDNVVIGSWLMEEFLFETPQNVTFNFHAFNSRGSDDYQLVVAVDGVSSNSNLQNIYYNGNAVTNFSANTLSYTVQLPFGTTNVPVVTAVAQNTNATITIQQAQNLNGTTAQRTATITVTAENGTAQKTYTVLFQVLAASNVATLSNLKVAGQTISGFNPQTFVYQYGLPYETVLPPLVSATATSPVASIEIFNATTLNGTVAQRTATVEVTAENGLSTNTYSVEFYRFEPSTNAFLQGIFVNSVAVAGFQQNVFSYLVELPYGTSVIPQVTASAAHPYASIAIENAVNLYGTQTERTTKIIVTAQNTNITQTYFVEFVVIPPSTNAFLSDLTVNGATVNGFQYNVLAYSVALPFGTINLPIVEADAQHFGALVEISGVTNLYGTEEERTANVTVTAEDNSSQLTYTIVFSITPANQDASLTEITINGSPLEEFTPTSLQYEVFLPFGTITIPNVQAIPNNPNAQVEITNATNIYGTEEERTATLLVTAEDITVTQTYYILFSITPAAQNADLSEITINGNVLEEFEPEVFDYAFSLPFGTLQVPQTVAIPTDENATVNIQHASNLTGTVEERTTTITVTAEDITVQQVYTILFSIALPSEDASLSNLTINGETIAGFSSQLLSYVYYVAYSEVAVPQVNSTTTHPNAIIETANATNLNGNEAERTTTITVTAEDGVTTLIYTVLFTKLPASNDASLSEILVNGEPLQYFHPNTLTYTVGLWYASGLPFISGEATHQFANVTAYNAINLTGTVEERTAVFHVIAEDGISEREYSVTFFLNEPNSLNEIELAYKMYPVPAKDVLFVEFENNIAGEQQITIFDIQGKNMLAEKISTQSNILELNITNLPNGIYLLKIGTLTKRFVIAR